MPARRLLVATYFYPPDTSVGSHRWPSMARWLRAAGHEVTILTTGGFGRLPDDDPWVVRTGDLQGAGALRRLLRRPATPATAPGAAPAGPAPRLLTDGLVPDAHLATWLPFALPAARRLVRERSIECVVTNGPPDSTHLLGLALGRGRPAWIADLEDGWRFEPQRDGWPTRAQDRLDARLEARVVRAADAVVGLARPIADDLADRFGSAAHYVPNGWDPDLDATGSPPELERGVVNIVHTGALTHAQRRDPRALVDGLARLGRETPEDLARLRLVLAGRLTTEDQRLLAELPAELAGTVRHVGELSRGQALALQRAADVLLLLATGPHRSQVTGKIFEYLAVGRPILAIASANEARRIVEETATGTVADPGDADAVVAALRRAARGELRATPRGVDAYTFPGISARYEDAVEDAIVRACGRPRGGGRPRPAGGRRARPAAG